MSYKHDNFVIIDDNANGYFSSVYVTSPSAVGVTLQDPLSNQGASYGYVAGGYYSSSSVIQRFSFVADENATSVGNLASVDGTDLRGAHSGTSSLTHGYVAGRYTPSFSNNISKFPFSASTTSSTVGTLLNGTARSTGVQQSMIGYGYTVAGKTEGAGLSNIIEKYSFISDGNSTDVGDMPYGVYSPGGISSAENGYIVAGYPDNYPNLSTRDNINKFPFTTDSNATTVAKLSVTDTSRIHPTGHSSRTHGYVAGGGLYGGGSAGNVIDRFPFATDTNASDVGDLIAPARAASGSSSKNSGYVTGGQTQGGSRVNVIQKFAFAQTSNAMDVGDLTTSGQWQSGHQV